jgi:hypothetical protein
MRDRLTNEYTEALWYVHKSVNQSADFVMYWWDRAAELLTAKGTRLKRFGLVTTNSISQVFQRRVIDRHLTAQRPVSILMAVPDHPWTKATKDAAAVRIAMTAVAAGQREGVLLEVVHEDALHSDQPNIMMNRREGFIHSNLTVGPDTSSSVRLLANAGLAHQGVKLHGEGFIVSATVAEALGLGRVDGLDHHIKSFRNGRDMAARPRDVKVIDLFGLEAEEVRQKFPEVYQHVIREVKEKVDEKGKLVGRDWNNREVYKKNWWIFGEPRSELRPSLRNLQQYVATVRTAKHRIFQMVPGEVLPESGLVALASDDLYNLAIVSSRVHVHWSLQAGGWLGIGNDPVYNASRCFDPFPFPDPVPETLKEQLRATAEELDATRKAVLEAHGDLTLTKLYNVLEKIKAG